VERTYPRGSAPVMMELAVLALNTPTAAARVPTDVDFADASAITGSHRTPRGGRGRLKGLFAMNGGCR
jgi:hypothetical protein